MDIFRFKLNGISVQPSFQPKAKPMSSRPDPSSERIHFDLTTLRLFEATAELGAVTKAAERIHLAPAAASRRIQEFEAQFGITLFDRLPHGMALTDAGRTLLAHVRSMIHSVARMQDDANAFLMGNMGVVRVAACTSVVLQFLAKDIKRCNALYPGIKIDLIELNSQGVLETVTRGVADIGIYESTLGGAMLPSAPYREDRLVLVTPCTHALAGRGSVTLDDILPHNVIGLSEGAAISLMLGRLATEMNRMLHMRIMVRSFHSMAAMIAEDIGIGLMPAAVAALLAGGEQFRRIPIEGEWATRRFVICHQPEQAMSSAATSLVQALSGPVSQNANPDSPK
ncbi:LysR family transcriptional regulator [Herbaspirillum sp. RV1423]|uniref:LysR family transcriptional regulator n=1 Tax=Herbaspirillum sp. RV1423 TaxID=1443993 RepID=UPI001E4D3478|nr:LysR family transcriptional regulator [Herbaspirillum sp. RV1423]